MSNKLKIHLTLRSENSKTGPIPVSTSPRETCPDSCTWFNKGCYASYGPLGIHWRKVSSGKNPNLISWEKYCKIIASLPPNQLARHNQAGDLPGKNRRISVKLLSRLVRASKGKRVFTYSHKPVFGKRKVETRNRNSIRAANRAGFTINLSADNLNHADELYNLNIAPVVVVVPSNAPAKNLYTPKGRKIGICPAQTTNYVTCESCKLCAIPTRKLIVGFRAHGCASKTVSQRAGLNIIE